MDDQTNLIAHLCPAMIEKLGSHTWNTIRMNISGDFTPQTETGSGSYSRESTAPLEDNDPDYDSFPKIYLNFNPGPRGSRGFEIGTNPNCDIVLPKLEHISRVHCALTFDDQRRLILQDFSSNGTIVEYNEEGRMSRRTFVTVTNGKERQHHFKWILGGDGVPRRTKNIVIDIQGIRFRINVFNHDGNLGQYNINVDRFLQQVQANDELPLGKFSIQSLPSTSAPSGAQTPSHEPIHLKQETLGRGSFAVVRRYWDVSTGFEYAYKEPVDRKRVDKELWEKEHRIMAGLKHDNLVKLVDAIYKPWPCLILEYVPLGTLRDQNLGASVAEDKLLTISRQSLSALAYLHGREPPITHRDIKPDNILVQSLQPLCIKLADFGLAKMTGSSLKTICGTATYAAPEIARYIGPSKDIPREKYTPAVDIWSLGVVILWCGYGLPSPGEGGGILWCTEIIRRVKSYESDDIIDLLKTAMLVHASKRETADVCLSRVLELSLTSRDGSVTPTPGSDFEEIPGSRKYDSKQELKSQSMPVTSCGQISLQQDESTDSKPSSVIRRYSRSEAPSPASDAPASGESRKRTTRSSTSSSSSGRRSKRHSTVTTARSSDRQLAESEPVINLFGENWLQDPNCVGSFVAAMGEETEEDLSNWSSWDTHVPRHPETYLPRSILEPVDENNVDDDFIQVRNASPKNAYPFTLGLQEEGNRNGTASDAQLAQALRAHACYE